MVTPISVSITAVDNATKIFQRMNANMERMQAPVKNLQRSFDRFSQLSGMTRLNEGFSRVRGSATSTFRVMGQIAPVLGTITSAVTIAGMTRLATSWANFGSNLQTTSQRLGMSVSGLHSWQNGARLAGVSAESMTAAMGSLQENIWNARGGRNPQFIATLNAMHVAMNNVDGSARSTEAIMNDVSNVIAKVKDPAAQAALATAAFGSAGNAMVPFLREGSAGMARYRQEALKYGVMNEAGAKAANQLRLAQARMTLSVEGFGYSLAQSVEPVLTPIITNMANWIAVNKDWVAGNIVGYVQQFSNYLKSINWQQVSTGAQQVWNSVKQFTQTIQENIDKIGGFKTVMEVVAGVLAVKVVGGVMGTIAPFASMAMTIGRMVVPILGSLLAVMTPVGLGIAAAGVVIGGAAAYIYKHWDSFKPYWDKLWAGVKSVFDIYVKGIQTILTPFTGLVGVIQKNWEPLTNFFGGMLDGIQKAFYSAFHYIGDIINKITSAIDKVGNALGLTKQQAEEVSNTMKIQPPSSALYTPNIANDNNPSSQRTSWGINGWLSGGDTGKSKPKSDTEKKIDRMTGQLGDWVSSWTNKISPAAKVAPAVPASTQKAIDQGQGASNVIQMPVVQQAQKAATNATAFNDTLNNHIQRATQGSNVSEAQMKALIMTESSARWGLKNAKSSAYGYTQLTKGTAKEVGVNQYDPFENVLGGRKYYEKMLKKVHGNSIAAYGAYHDGPASEGVKRFLASGGKDLSAFSSDALKAMGKFQRYLGQAQGGQLQLPNSVIPQGIAANNDIVQATMPKVPNMSNLASVPSITANSGLGQLDGGNGGSIPSAPITLPQAANDGSAPQKLLLEIDIKGKPAGMDIKAKSRSPSLTVESLNYERAMDPTASASGF